VKEMFKPTVWKVEKDKKEMNYEFEAPQFHDFTKTPRKDNADTWFGTLTL
jgi:hypothetical protein